MIRFSELGVGDWFTIPGHNPPPGHALYQKREKFNRSGCDWNALCEDGEGILIGDEHVVVIASAPEGWDDPPPSEIYGSAPELA